MQAAIVFLWIWAPFAIVFGVCAVRFRRRISQGIRANWEARGMKVGPRTQSPVVVAAGGVVFIVGGACAIVGLVLGVLGG